MSALPFGTDGVRGRAGEWPITVEVAASIGAALATAGRVLVVSDTRPSSDALRRAAVHGIRTHGGLAQDGGVAPTAAAQVWVASGLADRALVITASHNPAGDNGFKLIGPGGRKPDGPDSATLTSAPAEPGPGRRVDVAAALERVHLGALRARVSLPRRPWLLDTARGSWAPWAQRLVPGDARFDAGPGQINDGVGSEHPAALAAAVRARPGCVGVALDGDGDRVVLVDETGRVVPGDALIGLLAARSGAHRLVVTTMSSRALEAALPGVEVHRVDVGDRNVRARMDATGAPLGGEESGHVLRADFPGGDGLLMGLWALQLLGRDPLCEAVRPFLPWPRRAGRIAATTRKDIADVAAFVAQAEAAGGALVRWSGTEPVLRWMVEGPDEAALEGVASTLERELCAWVS